MKARLAAGLALTAFAAAAASGLSILGYAPSQATAAQAQYGPTSTGAPALSDTTPVEGQTITTSLGTWSTTPSSTDVAWQRCDADGAACGAIAGATSASYAVVAADVGKRLRSTVTARDASGATTAYSAPSEPVAKPGPSGQVKLPSGLVSIPAGQVSTGGQRLLISDVQFTPNPVRSRLSPITVRVRVKDTRGFVVRDAIVFVRSTPLVTTSMPERRTGQDGWVTFVTFAERDFQFKPGYAVQFFVRARRDGDDPLVGVSTRRLVQVGMAR